MSMGSFFRYTAKRKSTCDICGRDIPAGEVYAKYSIKASGEKYAERNICVKGDCPERAAEEFNRELMFKANAIRNDGV